MVNIFQVLALGLIHGYSSSGPRGLNVGRRAEVGHGLCLKGVSPRRSKLSRTLPATLAWRVIHVIPVIPSPFQLVWKVGEAARQGHLAAERKGSP
jgi:hypothetical protein